MTAELEQAVDAYRVTARTAALARRDRDDAIRRAHDAGMNLRAIGQVAGISHTAVAKILKRQ